jgi:cyclopropane fatty-acyl-phospholipid synthase-like methyltransferase
MRTATDFNTFYATPDPWQISRASFRDKVLRQLVTKLVAGKSVLELGCGEGHLTQAIFGGAARVTGIDLSGVAIDRARARAIPNATFMAADFLSVPFKGFDVIAAIECLYYLTPEDQVAFFEKAAREHRGKLLILSGPIIGRNEHRKYFTHSDLLETFKRHGAELVEHHNLNVYRRGTAANVAAVLVRLPFGDRLLDLLPESLIYQRCYIIRMM